MRHRSSVTFAATHGAGPVVVGVAAFLLGSPAALAEEAANVLTDPFYVALGGFVLDSDTNVRLDGEAGEQGTEINWENTFGGGDSTRFRIDGHWRFADRHKLRFLWFNASRKKSRVLEETIDWGDVEYPVEATLKSESSFDIYELAYEYAFLRRETYELTGSFGLHYTDLSLALSGEGSIDGEPVEGGVRKEGSVGAPLPVIGVRGLWRLPHDFWIDASAQFFALSIDEYDGNLTDFKVVATWQPKKWLGIGLGYNQFAVDVDVDQDKFKGSLDWTYKGPMLTFSAVF